ncbi:MAG: GTP-binding protein, partial [Spirochaetia bacterium]|nr:GTP-binding protein [Spirochaetia bacterium]
MSVSSTDLRNIAIVGHNGTGKTSLLEQILFQCGVISRAEKIDSGKTVSDYTEEEISKLISIHTSYAPVEFEGKQMNFLDTPGTADFIGEVISAFRSCENALMIVDARDGAQIETVKLWKRLKERNKPRAIFLNKCDRDRADYFSAFNHLKEQLPATYVPITIPMGSGKEFSGVINLIERKAYTYTENGKETQVDIPEMYNEVVDEYELLLIEAAAEGADDLIEKYFEEGTLGPEDIRRGLREGLKENRIVPVFAGASEKGSGINSLLIFIKNNFVSPIGRLDEIIRGEVKEELPISTEGPVAAYVFKTTIDQFSGKLSFVKVVQGTLAGDTDIMDPNIGKKERPGKVYHLIGKKLVEVPKLIAGDIGVIAKSNLAYTNCT